VRGFFYEFQAILSDYITADQALFSSLLVMWIYFDIIVESKEKNHQFFSASTNTLITIYNNNIKQPISKFTEPLQDTKQKPLPADSNPDGKVYLLASKLITESEKHIYIKKLLWFLCIVYSMG
jgi:hypothetical protein